MEIRFDLTHVKDSDALHDLLVHVLLGLGPVHLDGVTPQLEGSCGEQQGHNLLTTVTNPVSAVGYSEELYQC